MRDVTAVRGMLFEEAVLFLLRRAGYKAVTDVGNDPTLRSHAAGLGIAVVGRGAYHQIDAIADYLIGQPFSHPQRLLVEAKCYTNAKAVDLDTTRSAVGVLKDVSEYWATVDGLPRDQRRYHYQKAIFSAATFTGPAERYAFAHDIYLFPLAQSSCFKPLLDAIFAIRSPSYQRGFWVHDERPLRTLRLAIRRFLEQDPADDQPLFGGDFGNEWVNFGREVRQLGGVIVALVGRAFPLFLVPSSREVLDDLGNWPDVRIRYWSTRGWAITDTRDRVLFSFDLPPLLFHMYSEARVLTRAAAANMKADLFTDLQAIVFRNAEPRLIRFNPDAGWLHRLQTYAAERADVLLRAE
jgi:hypothetical protein